MRTLWPWLMLVSALGACKEPALPVAELPPNPTPVIVGGDRDAHGCIGAAGYAWCERTGRCERPWELAKTAGFTLNPGGFQAHCSKKE